MVTPGPAQRDIWWADLADPVGSAAGYRRPVLVVQCDALNARAIATAVCVPLTSNLKWSKAPGNVTLSARSTGLDKDSVANVSLIVAIDKDQLDERTGRISERELDLVFAGIDVVLGR